MVLNSCFLKNIFFPFHFVVVFYIFWLTLLLDQITQSSQSGRPMTFHIWNVYEKKKKKGQQNESI